MFGPTGQVLKFDLFSYFSWKGMACRAQTAAGMLHQFCLRHRRGEIVCLSSSGTSNVLAWACLGQEAMRNWSSSWFEVPQNLRLHGGYASQLFLACARWCPNASITFWRFSAPSKLKFKIQHVARAWVFRGAAGSGQSSFWLVCLAEDVKRFERSKSLRVFIFVIFWIAGGSANGSSHWMTDRMNAVGCLDKCKSDHESDGWNQDDNTVEDSGNYHYFFIVIIQVQKK